MPERRRVILDATLRLIAADGIDAVRHRAVAHEAGVPLAATTYYFMSKDEMIEDALVYAAEVEMARVAAHANELRATDLSPAAWASAFTRWFAQSLAPEGRSRLAWRYQLKLLAGHSGRCHAVCARWIDRDTALLVELLKRSGSRNPDRDAVVVLAAIEGLSLNAYASRADGIDEPAVNDQIKRMITALTT